MAGVQLWMGPSRVPVAVPGDAGTKLIYDVSTSLLRYVYANMSKETYPCGTRGLLRWHKRPTKVAQEA